MERDPANLPVVFAPRMKLGEPQAGVKQLLVKKLPIEYDLNEPDCSDYSPDGSSSLESGNWQGRVTNTKKKI